MDGMDVSAPAPLASVFGSALVAGPLGTEMSEILSLAVEEVAAPDVAGEVLLLMDSLN